EVPEAAEGVPDTLTDSTDGVTEALADPADGVTEAVEASAEHHAHEHPLHRAEAAVVPRRVRLVGTTALPVGNPLRADHDLADVGLGPRPYAFDVERAGRDVAGSAAGRGP